MVREGKAHREIVSYAVEEEIDLILIGAHGEGFKLGSLFGSNTDRVLRESPCPVFIVTLLKATLSLTLNMRKRYSSS